MSLKAITALITGLFLSLNLSLEAQNLKVVTLNLGPDHPKDSLDHWEARKSGLVGMVRFHELDIWACQMAQGHHMSYLKEELREFALLEPETKIPAAPKFANPIFYRKDRFVPEKSGLFWLSPTPDEPSKGWDAESSVTCTYALFYDRMTENRFWVANARLAPKGKEARRESLQVILRKLEVLNEAPNLYPVLVLGDFNCSPNDPALSILNEQMVDASQLGEHACYGPIGTFTNFKMGKAPAKLQRQDYLYCSRQGWVVERCGVLTDTYRGRYLSDHLPVFVEFRQLSSGY